MKDKRWFWLIFIVLFIIFVIWLVTFGGDPFRNPGWWSAKFGI